MASLPVLGRIIALLVLLVCCAPANARRVRRGEVQAAANNNVDLNNPANPDSASFHSLYNGRGNGRDGNPASPLGKSGRAKPRSSGGGSNGISYYGGPVMTAPVNVYVIWYGTWTTTGQAIITDLLNNLGGSPWWAISTTYYNSANVKVSSTVTLAGSTTDSYSQGTSLSDGAIWTAVSSAISSGRLPSDANGVYFLLTAPDVTATSGFCTSYCGWHTYATLGGTYIKYSFVGNPQTRCLSACAAQSIGPNGDAGVDAMASVLAHELTEAASDPLLNAWYDSKGYENADKCAWTFGTTSTTTNGAKYNVALGSRQYLLQQNWVNANGGKCALRYP